MCPTTLLQMLAQPRRMSSIKFHSSTSEARDSLHASSCQNRRSYTVFLYHVDTEEVHSWVSRITILSKAWIRFNELPPCPQDQCWYKHKREKSNAPVCDQSKKLLVCTTSNIKIPGQGDTHRVKMKSKASSQTTDAVVAEWQSACETHGFAILSQTLRSVLTLPATWASINPPGKDSRKARWLPVL